MFLILYNLSQTISEPTRITNTSRTLIDLCITNSPDKVKASGVLSIGISDHSPVYLIRKTSYHKASVDASVEKRRNFIAWEAGKVLAFNDGRLVRISRPNRRTAGDLPVVQ